MNNAYMLLYFTKMCSKIPKRSSTSSQICKLYENSEIIQEQYCGSEESSAASSASIHHADQSNLGLLQQRPWQVFKRSGSMQSRSLHTPPDSGSSFLVIVLTCHSVPLSIIWTAKHQIFPTRWRTAVTTSKTDSCRTYLQHLRKTFRKA